MKIISITLKNSKKNLKYKKIHVETINAQQLIHKLLQLQERKFKSYNIMSATLIPLENR